MFVGWEGVGLASYLLIGFYFNRRSAASARKKAFIVNSIGDFGFLISVFLLLANFGTLTFTEIAAKLTVNNAVNLEFLNGVLSLSRGTTSPPSTGVLTAICLCLLLGAAGKSAQLPLYIWLPDAMEGPTPVSALIHAATMVTAGVYMIARTHVLFDHAPIALATVAVVGAATALFAATIGLVQTDIKRVLAYSTITQLGYMFLACGVAARTLPRSFTSSRTHSAEGPALPRRRLSDPLARRRTGSAQNGRLVAQTSCHLLDDDGGRARDCRNLSLCWLLLKRRDPQHQAGFTAGPAGQALWFVGLITALLTSIYMFRLWYLAFLGKPRTADVHPHESPVSMLFPLIVLAALSICGGWIGIERFSSFLAPAAGQLPAPTTPVNPHLEGILSVAAVLVAFLGWFIADLLYRRKRERPARLVADIPGAYQLLVNKYYVDEFYGSAIVRPLFGISKYILGWVVDAGILGGIVWLLAGTANLSGTILQRWQSGNLRSYAAWLALGAAVLLIATLSFNSGWGFSFVSSTMSFDLRKPAKSALRI